MCYVILEDFETREDAYFFLFFREDAYGYCELFGAHLAQVGFCVDVSNYLELKLTF